MSDEVKVRGRPKGAKSLVSVPLKTLVERFTDNDMIVIGNVWAKKAGIENLSPAISAPLAPEVKGGITVVVPI